MNVHPDRTKTTRRILDMIVGAAIKEQAGFGICPLLSPAGRPRAEDAATIVSMKAYNTK
jgi:hypothetical protein